MGKPTGFLEYPRKTGPELPPQQRLQNFNEFHLPLSPADQARQAARCMDCGVPFCQAGQTMAGMTSGCPLHNLIPETNDLVYRGALPRAWQRLQRTNCLPEFTARRGVYNQTCGKTEQSALKIYIESGELEKHLRRLRKLYYAKSRYFCEAAAEIFPDASVTLFESSLTVELEFKDVFDAATVFAAALKEGIALSEPADGTKLRLCFAGISEEEIIPALTKLRRCADTALV